MNTDTGSSDFKREFDFASGFDGVHSRRDANAGTPPSVFRIKAGAAFAGISQSCDLKSPLLTSFCPDFTGTSTSTGLS